MAALDKRAKRAISDRGLGGIKPQVLLVLGVASACLSFVNIWMACAPVLLAAILSAANLYDFREFELKFPIMFGGGLTMKK